MEKDNPQRRQESPDVSVLIPISERHDDIEEIYRQHQEMLQKLGYSSEFIFVLAGSFPAAAEVLARLEESESDFQVIRFPRSYGEARALSDAFEVARGRLILTLAAYFQIQPEEIGKLFAELTPELDMITGRRYPRRDNWLNRAQSRLFHAFVTRLTGEDFRDISIGVRLIRREVLEKIGLYGDLHRFLPILAVQSGFMVKEIPLKQAAEDCGLRLYAPGVYWRRALDILSIFFLFKFTQKPLRFFGIMGSAISLLGLLIVGTTLVQRLFMDQPLAERPLFLVGVLISMVGLQTFFIGLLGEIIIFTHMPEQPRYKVEKSR
jgi:glycosyltransferase involved in cell wall biosynthesis